MEKMKPCPFCGRKYDFSSEEGIFVAENIRAIGYTYKCPKCEIMTDFFSTIKELRDYWNNRIGELK